MKKRIISILLTIMMVVALLPVSTYASGDGFTYDENDPTIITGYEGAGGDIVIPAFVTEIGESAFKNNENITSVTFEEGSQLTTIGCWAFDGMMISSITIPASVKYIEGSAFYSCANLAAIEFEEGSLLETVGDGTAFSETAITEIKLPTSIKYLGEKTFDCCSNLSDVYVGWTKAKDLPELGVSVFNEIEETATLHVPSGTKAIYEAADQWKDFIIDDGTTLSSVTLTEAPVFTSSGESSDITLHGSFGEQAVDVKYEFNFGDYESGKLYDSDSITSCILKVADTQVEVQSPAITIVGDGEDIESVEASVLTTGKEYDGLSLTWEKPEPEKKYTEITPTYAPECYDGEDIVLYGTVGEDTVMIEFYFNDSYESGQEHSKSDFSHINVGINDDYEYDVTEATLTVTGDGDDLESVTAKVYLAPVYEGGGLQFTWEKEESYPVWIGYHDDYNSDIQVKAGDVLGDGTVIYTPDADYPDTKGTLTLNNAKLFTGDSDVAPAAIMVGDENHPFTELTIELIGDNQIGKTVAQFPEELKDGDYSVGYGILAYGSVTFTGKGNLTIYDQTTGILASSASSLQSGQKSISFGTETQPFTGTVTVNDYGTPAYYVGAITTDGDVTINGGKVDLASKAGCGIVAQGTGGVTVNDGKLNVECGYYGIVSLDDDVTISGGEVDVAADLMSIYSPSGDVTITGGKVDVTADVTPNSMGIYATNVTISGGNVDVTAGSHGIQSENDVTISGGTVGVTSDEAEGIYAYIGDVTISGENTEVTVNAEKTGIYAYGGDVEISGATVDVTSNGAEGIYSYGGDVIISGGTVNATAETFGLGGMYAANVTITGGKVTATSNSEMYNAIYAENVTISGDNTDVTVSAQAIGIGAGSLAISGDNMTVKVNSEGYGISTGANVTIKGDDTVVTVDAPAAGIYAGTYIDVSGSTVNVTSDGTGIFSPAIAISGGTVKAKGETAIAARNGLVIDTDEMEIQNTNEPYEAETAITLTAKDGGYVTIQKKQPAPTVVIRPTVTIPVSGDEGSVNVKATVSGNTATVKPIKDEEIQKVIGDDVKTGTVVIDLSGTNRNITAAKLPADTVQAIAETAADAGSDTAGLKLVLSSGALEFDTKTLETIAAAAGDAAYIEIHFDEVGTTRMNNVQKAAVSEMDVLEGFEAYVTVNGKRVSDFEGGNVVVYIPYEVPEDKEPAAYIVWYVAEDGTLEKMDASYDGENHRFVVSHFSDYVLTYDETVGQYNNCPQDNTCPMSEFTDLDVNAWYHDGVHYCLEEGIMVGYPGELFMPDGTTSRAQIAQILYNLEGQPAFMNDNIFSDVASGSWYEKAVVWAQGKGVVAGYPDGTFKPDAPITREQLAVILYNYAQYKGIDVSVDENTNFLSFNDFWDTSEWAKPAMMWAIERELMVDDNWDLKPQGDAVRVLTATVICKFCETVAK